MNFDPVPDPLPKMRAWVARTHNFSFCISLEMESGDPEWNGYTASWKNTNADMHPFGKQRANRIDGGPWQTFSEAEDACRATLKQLIQKQ